MLAHVVRRALIRSARRSTISVRRIAGYVFAPERLALETYGGEEIEIRDVPRGAFAGHANETSWDQFHAAYFYG